MDQFSAGYLLLQQSQFQSNFIGSFQELRTAGEFLDVTLACEDETVEAHKVVISACSPFFRRVLSKAKQKHPFIYLKGVLHQDLLALMDYMYNGETKVPAEHVDRFIEAAQELKIKGLAEDEVNEVEEKEEETTVPKEIYLKEEPSENKEIYVNARLEMEISKIIVKTRDAEGKTLWKCGECGKIDKKKNHLVSHIETHLEGFSHKCEQCERVFKTRNSLNSHVFLVHKEKRDVKEEIVESEIEISDKC